MKSKLWWGEDDWHADDGKDKTLVALSPEDDTEDTGLLDANGNPIVRQIRWPAGFIRFPTPHNSRL